MKKTKEELARTLHDFKAPLSSTRMALLFMLEGRAGKINSNVKKLLDDLLDRNQKLLDKIEEFENNHG